MSLLARLSRIQDPLDLLDTGVDADTVIDTLRQRWLPLKGLNLGHNNLGDKGVTRLLKYLRTPQGAALGVSTLGLTTTGISNAGLAALAYHFKIANGSTLEELSLQNNKFTGDPSSLTYFAHGVNASPLRKLYLSSNNLGDVGLAAFFDALDAPALQELQVSAVGLSDAGAPALCNFLGSRRSASLRVLHMNGNGLGPAGVAALVKAVDAGNFGLEKIELFSNDIAPDDKLLARLGILLERNRLMRNETRRSALQLLTIARVVLLHPRPAPAPSPSTSTALVLWSSRAPAPDERVAWWLSLPYELRLHVLRFAVDESALSQAQHARVCAYAETPVARSSPASVDAWLELVGCAAYEPDDS
ncbi:RNI-like protein [Auricularia subglabra TFB-10046 SS5]|nr:RNI-like protein [Auricularia subglabra TFB-10046 SS5]